MVANSLYIVCDDFYHFSDDRTVESFTSKIESATGMKALGGKDPRPNCLIIDEIDGAPQVFFACIIAGTFTCIIEGTFTCIIVGTFTYIIEGTFTCSIEGCFYMYHWGYFYM